MSDCLTEDRDQERLHVVTPTTRLDNLPILHDGLLDLSRRLRAHGGTLDLWWWVILDCAPGPLPAPLRALLTGGGVPLIPLFHPGAARDPAGRPAFGHVQRSAALDHIRDGWVWTLDDDNLPHPDFGRRLPELIRDHPGAGAIVVGLEFPDGRRFHAAPAEAVPYRVDTAQYVLRRDLIGDERLRPAHADDGAFLQRLYARHHDRFAFCDEVLAWHNRLTME